MKWKAEHIPSLEGRMAVVTGANSGLGYHTARALAMKGARVVMACRDAGRGEQARQMILAGGPPVEPELEILDLASLDSVRDFARRLLDGNRVPDILVNNAGQMAIPLARTREGFEMQFGVSHLGHFVLTAHLWPGLREKHNARIIQVSSLMHRKGRIRFEDPNWEQEYSRWGGYGMAKLAAMLFMKELDRRIRQGGLDVLAAAAHPGYTNTPLQEKSMKLAGAQMKAGLFRLANYLLAQPGWKGALPILFAATSPQAASGAYYGPDGLLRLKGWPVEEAPHPLKVNDRDAGRLWELSEELTSTPFRIS